MDGKVVGWLEGVKVESARVRSEVQTPEGGYVCWFLKVGLLCLAVAGLWRKAGCGRAGALCE